MINVYYIDLPIHVGGCVSLDEGGEYSIHINAKLSDEMKSHVFAHELNHIKCGHQEAVDNIDQCEKDAWVQPVDQDLLDECVFWGYCTVQNYIDLRN